MLKILQTRLQQFMNQELPDVKAKFKEAEEIEIKLPTSIGSQKKQEFQKNICFIDYTKAFVIMWITTNWEILKEMGIPDYLAYILRNV